MKTPPSGDSAELLDLAEEPFDAIAPAIGCPVEGGHRIAAREGLDLSFGPPCGQRVAQRIHVVCGIGEQARPEGADQGQSGLAVTGLTRGQVQGDRQPARICHGVRLGRQAPARTPQCAGSKVSQGGGAGPLKTPLLALAPCG
jgi:hypothetical protein